MSEIQLFKNASISKKSLDDINARLPEYQRASSLIGHSTSQTSYSLQSLNMISDSPISRMKQCLAQINNRYLALRESHFKVEKDKIVIEELEKKTDKKSRLELEEKRLQLEDAVKNMNQSLRQIGMFQDMYDSIRKNNNIPKNWSEKDYEKQEIERMIKSCYRLGIQDLSATGRVGKAFVEYSEQLGIHPQVAEAETRIYMNHIQDKLSSGQVVTIKDMFIFLDAMVEKHKNDWEEVLARMGLDQLGSERYCAESVRDINK